MIYGGILQFNESLKHILLKMPKVLRFCTTIVANRNSFSFLKLFVAKKGLNFLGK